jgi:hypothetical protein
MTMGRLCHRARRAGCDRVTGPIDYLCLVLAQVIRRHVLQIIGPTREVTKKDYIKVKINVQYYFLHFLQTKCRP